MKVSIITVTFNSSTFLENYFTSINNQNFKDLELIIIDSGSTDDTITKIQEKFIPLINSSSNISLKIIKNGKNLGFTGGNNLGGFNANGEYLFFLNPDTKLEKDCIENLWLSSKENSEKDFILIPRQKNYETLQFTNDGVCVDIFGYPYKIYNSEKPKETKPPFFCDGAAMFLPKKTFGKLGAFDEELFMFNDDVDFSWRAHLFNVPLINVPRAVVFHFSGGSMRGGARKEKVYKTSYFRRYLGERNAIRNILKNYSYSMLILILPIYVLINLFEVLVFLLGCKPKAALQYLYAWGWNIQNIKSTLKRKRYIQKNRVINDRAILKKMYFGSGKLNAFLSIKIPDFE